MIEKIILYLAIISFVIFIISFIKFEEYVGNKYKKIYNKTLKDVTKVVKIDSVLYPFQLFFFSDEIGEKDEKIKRILMIYRISFIVFLISIITFILMTR